MAVGDEGRRSARISGSKGKRKVPDTNDDCPVLIVGPKKAKAERAPDFIEGEEPESESLEILEEDPLDYTADPNTLPVRTLEGFYFYDALNSLKLVSLDEVGADNRDVCAVGKVKAIREWVDEFAADDESEAGEVGSEDGTNDAAEMDQVVRLSSIFYWEISHTPCGSSNIFVRTTYAWYKLLYPHPDYARFYVNILKRTRLANIVVNCMVKRPNLTYEEFLRELPTISGQCEMFPNAPPIRLRPSDFVRYIPYIKEEVQSYVEANDAFELLAVPLFEKLMGTPDGDFGLPERQRPHRTVRKATSSNEDKTTPPVFTPTISKLASGFIHYSSALEGSEEPARHDEREREKLHEALLNDLKFGRPTKQTIIMKELLTSLDGKGIYAAAKVGSVTIQAGDFIIVADPIACSNRVIRVCHLFQGEDGTGQALGRAFLTGRDTLMGELATDNELFLTDIIQAYPLTRFVGGCEVAHATSGQDESEFAGRFFFRYLYEIETGGYVDARPAINKGWAKRWCPVGLTQPQAKGDVVKARTFTYHKYDFVYVIPTTKDTPYEIAQILPPTDKRAKTWFTTTAEGDVLVRLRYYRRVEVDGVALGTKHGPKKYVPDSRHLYRTNKFSMLDVNRLEGICYVNHRDAVADLEAYCRQNDCFYVVDAELEGEMGDCHPPLVPLPKAEPVVCRVSEDQRLKELKRVEATCANHKPLRALDIFSGCGGLSLGMKRSGLVQTKYAIEFNCGAAITYKKNFPGATVYNQCANLLLKRAILRREKQPLTAAKDFMGQPLPDMPQPGDVDLIYCGPPCQGFSGINRFKKANDIKNSLIATTLSYVDFYRPKYFMLENVRGLLSFCLGGNQAGINRVEGGIKMGYVKFIVRCLTHMGYQARIGIQQAGNFGLAQSRRRVIIWGAHLGLKLPDYPQPTHCFMISGSVSLPLPHSTNYIASRRTNNCAPHPAVTIYDAIADLEGFEYRNPCKVYPTDATEARDVGFPRISVAGRPFVGKMQAEYVQPPFSEFQRLMRKGASLCYNHVTRPFNDITIERICRIQMAPGSDHSSLPEKLKPWCLSHKDSAAGRHNGWKGLFGRLDYKGHFLTALTDIQPMGKQGTVLHPSQRRVLTVRECARAQGFPDSFIFLSYAPDDTKDMHRQVGNAVPPPLATALSHQLVLALAANLHPEVDLSDRAGTSNLEEAFMQALDTRLATLAISRPPGAHQQPKRLGKPGADPSRAPPDRPRRPTKGLRELSDASEDDLYVPRPTRSRGAPKAAGSHPEVEGRKSAVVVAIPSSRYRYLKPSRG
ncbi:hypothetical protein L0F63_007074 [Massospora cicadina]|nr:hypothetical protein L0F63_007074 [Massospora cicadina]